MSTQQPKRSRLAEWYGVPAPTAAQVQAAQVAADAQFRALYSDSVWVTMSPAEQAQARAAWDGQQQVIATARDSGDKTRALLIGIFVGIPAVLIVIFVVISLISAGS